MRFFIGRDATQGAAEVQHPKAGKRGGGGERFRGAGAGQAGGAKADAPRFLIVIVIFIIIWRCPSQNLGREPKPPGNQSGIRIKIKIRIKNVI